MGVSKDIVDIFVLVLLGGGAIVLSTVAELKFLPSTLLFFGAPAAFLAFRLRHKNQWKHILTMSFVFGTLYGFILDYLAEVNNAWAWSNSEQLYFTYKILGVVNIDVMIWFFLWVFLIVLFYERFLDVGENDRVPKKALFAIAPGILALVVIVFGHVYDPAFWSFPYAYLVLGLFTLPPFIILLVRRYRLVLKFLKAALYFVPLYLAYELNALPLGQWDFPGQYIGTVTILNTTLPLEEFLVWILLSSTIVLAYYELYVDDLV